MGCQLAFFMCDFLFIFSHMPRFRPYTNNFPQLSVYYRSLNCSPAIAAPENRMKSFILRHLTFEPWHPLSNVSHFPLHHLHFWRKVSPKERMSSGKKRAAVKIVPEPIMRSENEWIILSYLSLFTVWQREWHRWQGKIFFFYVCLCVCVCLPNPPRVAWEWFWSLWNERLSSIRVCLCVCGWQKMAARLVIVDLFAYYRDTKRNAARQRDGTFIAEVF